MSREKQIIRSFYKDAKHPKDDCFLFEDNKLVTTDVMTENTHFRNSWSKPAQLAEKLIEVNVSDIVCSGGLPTHVFLNLGIPVFDKTWMAAFSKATKNILAKHSISLSGGDTFRSEKIYLGMTMIGSVIHHTPRTNAQPGEFVYITGAVGYSLLGYKFLKKNRININQKPFQKLEEYKYSSAIRKGVKKHLTPGSRIDLFPGLLKQGFPSAAIDITDGLHQDASNLAESSKVKIIIDVDKLPERKSLDQYLSIEEQLSSGEELEILFTSPRHDLGNLDGISHIGYVKKGRGVQLLAGKNNLNLKIPGFFHF